MHEIGDTQRFMQTIYAQLFGRLHSERISYRYNSVILVIAAAPFASGVENVCVNPVSGDTYI